MVGDELIASRMLTIIPDLTRGGLPYGVVENVVTHGEHRLRGHGRRVLEAALSPAWAQHCYKVMLTTGRHDDGVTRFYRSVGFAADEKQAFVARPVG